MPTLNNPPPDVGRNPDRLYQYLRSVTDDLRQLHASIGALQRAAPQTDTVAAAPLTHPQLQQIRDALQTGGAAELNLTGLIGKSSEPQLAAPVVASTLAALNASFPASRYLRGTLAVTTTVPATVYYVDIDGVGAHRWTAFVGIPADMAKTDADNAFTVIQTLTAGALLSNGPFGLRVTPNVNTTPYTISNTEIILDVNSGGIAITVKLPPAPIPGQIHIVKDAAGASAANNITIDSNGTNIDGVATKVLNVNYSLLRVYYANDGGLKWATW